MGDLVERFARQLAAKGIKDAKSMAIALLKKRGHLNDKGELTAEGKKRQAMGDSGRAKDRASKASGHKPSDYKYDKKTNSATLKGKK